MYSLEEANYTEHELLLALTGGSTGTFAWDPRMK